MGGSSTDNALPGAEGDWKIVAKSGDAVLRKNENDEFMIGSFKKLYKNAKVETKHLPRFTNKGYTNRLRLIGTEAVTAQRVYRYSGGEKLLFIYRLNGEWNYMTEKAFNKVLKDKKWEYDFVKKAEEGGNVDMPDASEKNSGSKGLDSAPKKKRASTRKVRGKVPPPVAEESSESSESDEFTSGSETDSTTSGSDESKYGSAFSTPARNETVSTRKGRQDKPPLKVEEVSDSDDVKSSAASSGSDLEGSDAFASDSEPDSSCKKKKRPPVRQREIVFARVFHEELYNIVKRGDKFEMYQGDKASKKGVFEDDDGKFVPNADRQFIQAQLLKNEKLNADHYKVLGCVGFWRGEKKAVYWRVVLLEVIDEKTEQKLKIFRKKRGSPYRGPLMASFTQFTSAFKGGSKTKEAEKFFKQTKLGKEKAEMSKSKELTERNIRYETLEPDSINYQDLIDRLRREHKREIENGEKERQKLEKEMERLKLRKSSKSGRPSKV